MPYKEDPHDTETTLPRNKISNQRRRVNRARRFMENTCPASRHVHQIADNLMRYGEDHIVKVEPEHAASSMYSVLESLWKARTEIKRLKALTHPTESTAGGGV